MGLDHLDSLDRKIVRGLRHNARQSNAELAAAVGLSPSACLRRVRLLEQRGVIRGYVALIDEGEEEPGGIIAIVQLTLERQSEDYLSRFEAAVRRHPEIRECYLMTGASDYHLRVAAPNAADYTRIHTEVLSRLPGVARIHSSIAMRDALRPRRVTDR